MESSGMEERHLRQLEGPLWKHLLLLLKLMNYLAPPRNLLKNSPQCSLISNSLSTISYLWSERMLLQGLLVKTFCISILVLSCSLFDVHQKISVKFRSNAYAVKNYHVIDGTSILLLPKDLKQIYCSFCILLNKFISILDVWS